MTMQLFCMNITLFCLNITVTAVEALTVNERQFLGNETVIYCCIRLS